MLDAPNAAKVTALRELAKVSCGAPDICETRDVCEGAYTLHVEALALTQAAKQQLGDSNAAGAAKLLGASEQKLNEASRKVSDCTNHEGALRLRYKL
jgi:hypothetical protein